jgi:hypothetical protein
VRGIDLVKAAQAQIAVPYIEDVKIKLVGDQDRLQYSKEIVARLGKSGSAMSASYLSMRDEISYPFDDITALKNVVTGDQGWTTRMLAPIYARDAPIASKKTHDPGGRVIRRILSRNLNCLSSPDGVKDKKSPSCGVL